MQMASSAEWTGRLCTSASLYTTTLWIPSSRHARMTRSAISPRFAMRILSNEIERLLQCRGIRHVRGPRIGEDPFHEAGQDVAGPELDECRRALPSSAPHRGDPLYGRVDLPRDLQRDDALRACGLEVLGRLGHRGERSGDDDLARRVVVRDDDAG